MPFSHQYETVNLVFPTRTHSSSCFTQFPPEEVSKGNISANGHLLTARSLPVAFLLLLSAIDACRFQ